MLKPGAVILERLGLLGLEKIIPDRLLRARFKLYVPRLTGSLENIDWSKTKAYSSAFGIYINLKDRTPYGIVEPGHEYEKVRDEILQKLHEFSDPATGEKQIVAGMKKEEVYSGPYLDFAPDIVFDYIHCKPVPMPAFRFSRVMARKSRFGTHAQEGMFSLNGPGIRSNHRVNGCHIADITPTLMYLLGQPIPEDFDGEVMTKIFEENYIQNQPARYSKPSEIKLCRGNQEDTYSPEEAAAVAARLRDLGYME
jgi:hypothetical protein